MMQKLDSWLLWKLFWPLAKKIDYYLHKNPAEIATKVLMLATVLMILEFIIHAGSGWLKWAGYAVCGLCVAGNTFHITKLTRISKSYEERPEVMPAEQLTYIIAPFYRFFNFGLGMLFLPGDIFTSISHNWLYFIIHFPPRCWFLCCGIAFYFAALPRPPAKRKEYKMPDLNLSLTPATASTQ